VIKEEGQDHMTLDQAVAELEKVYGRSGWLSALAGMGPDQTKGFARLVQGILGEGPLPLKIKHFMLFVIHVAKGHETLARLHAERAVDEGATTDEFHEVLAVFLPSRGTAMYLDGARALGGIAGGTIVSSTGEDTRFESTEEILAYFNEAMGTLPGFVRLLAEHKPTLLEGYFKLRSENLKDRLIPQKYKELMLVALNTAERYQTGVEIHAKAALGCGATSEELLDGMTTAILGGGIPGWIEAAQVYARLVR
jgi:alkylhydroperoxidase/carboxymuconolactone decarboxylase family protein YurZ